MNQLRHKKHAPLDGIGYEAHSDARSTPVRTIDHPYFTRPGEDNLAGEKSSAILDGLTRDEVEARLKQRGLSQEQRRVVLASSFGGKSLAAIAREVHKSKTWVANTLNRATEHLQTPTRSSIIKCTGSTSLPPLPLKDAMKHARKCFENFHSFDEADFGHKVCALAKDAPDSAEHGTVADQNAVALIAQWPHLLTHAEHGQRLTKILANLFYVARFGSRTKAAVARKTLAPLARYQQGSRCPIPDTVLASESLSICVTVAELQRVWQTRRASVSGETRQARLETVRERVSPIVEGFTDRELLLILQGDLLTASARLAEEATGIASESFVRVWRQMEEIQVLQESLRQ